MLDIAFEVLLDEAAERVDADVALLVARVAEHSIAESRRAAEPGADLDDRAVELVSLLVRSWNVFHGNAKPPERRSFLEEMVRLASADKPDVLCLQELPVWALSRLGDWSGMSTFGEVAMRPGLGPLPATASVGRALTSIHHGLFRSAFSGQANAILVAPGIRALDRERIVLNPRRFRRAQARW